MNEVAIRQPDTNTILIVPVTDGEIEKLAAEFKEVPADLSVKENYELCRKAAATCRALRGDTEKWRKDKKADALAWGKKVDSAAKAITERLFAIEEPFATAKKKFDTAAEIAKREAALAEECRVDEIADRIASIKATVEKAISSTSAQIKEMMANISTHELPCDWAMEFKDKAVTVATETMLKLDELLVMKIQQEESARQQAELEAKRKAEEEQRRKEEDEARRIRDAEIAEERRKIEEERKKLEEERRKIDEEKAEAERLKKQKEEEEKTEAERIELEARKKAEAEKKNEMDGGGQQPEPDPEVNKYKAAGRAIMKITGNKQMAKALLDAIINGEIPYITYGE